MKPKEAQDLIILLQSAQNAVSLSSGGIADMTFEWYGKLIHDGYSAGLILQDLISK